MTDENDTDPFNAAFDRREESRILSEIDMSFRRAGLAVEHAEHQRVASLIEREQQYRTREQDRQLAEYEVRDGVYVNFSDSVVEPTEEWLRQGPIRKFTPRQPKDTVRTITTVRRVLTPIVIRMHGAGKITDDQLAACLWYRERFETAGLEGRYKTSHISLAGNTGGSGGMGQAPMAQHEHEVWARNAYRDARDCMARRFVRFFEAITLHDTPLRRATRFAKCDNNRAFSLFRGLAQQLVEHCESRNIQIGPENDSASDG